MAGGGEGSRCSLAAHLETFIRTCAVVAICNQRGYLELLKQLTVVGDVPLETFKKRIAEAAENKCFFVVIEHTAAEVCAKEGRGASCQPPVTAAQP